MQFADACRCHRPSLPRRRCAALCTRTYLFGSNGEYWPRGSPILSLFTGQQRRRRSRGSGRAPMKSRHSLGKSSQATTTRKIMFASPPPCFVTKSCTLGKRGRGVEMAVRRVHDTCLPVRRGGPCSNRDGPAFRQRHRWRQGLRWIHLREVTDSGNRKVHPPSSPVYLVAATLVVANGFDARQRNRTVHPDTTGSPQLIHPLLSR